MVDAAWEAAQGLDKFKDGKVEARTLDGALSQPHAGRDRRGHGHQQAVRPQGQARVHRLAPAAAPRSWRMRDARGGGHRPQEGHQAGAPGRGRVGQRDQGQEDRRVLLGGRRADRGGHRPRGHAGHEDQADRPRRSGRRDEQEVRAAVREGHDRGRLVPGAWTRRRRTSTCGTSWSRATR